MLLARFKSAQHDQCERAISASGLCVHASACPGGAPEPAAHTAVPTSVSRHGPGGWQLVPPGAQHAVVLRVVSPQLRR